MQESGYNYLMDMDGVLVREEHLVPGADQFVAELRANGTRFMVLTNNSIYTPRDLRARLLRSGLDIPGSIWTSARPRPASCRAAARRLRVRDRESGLTTALHNAGYVLTDSDPDYVVLGETRTYSFEAITAPSGWWRTVPGSSPPTRTRRVPAVKGRFRRPGSGRTHREGHRALALLRGQAQPADDALGAAHWERTRRTR